MLKRIRGYIIILLVIGAVYYLMSHHFVFKGRDFWQLEKSELTLEYTLFSIAEKDPEDILEIQPLRNAGVGEILVELEMLTEDERYELEDAFDYEQSYDEDW